MPAINFKANKINIKIKRARRPTSDWPGRKKRRASECTSDVTALTKLWRQYDWSVVVVVIAVTV